MSARVWVTAKRREGRGHTSVYVHTGEPPSSAGGVEPGGGRSLLEMSFEDFVRRVPSLGVDVLWVDGVPHGMSARGARVVLETTGDMSWGVIRPSDLPGEVVRRIRERRVGRDAGVRITWPVGRGLITMHDADVQEALDRGLDVEAHAGGVHHIEEGRWVGLAGMFLPIGVEGSDHAPVLVESPCGCLRVFVKDPEVVGAVVSRCEREGVMRLMARVCWDEDRGLEVLEWR